MFIWYLDENNFFPEGVIEGVHIDKVDGGSVIVIDFGYFEVAWVIE